MDSLSSVFELMIGLSGRNFMNRQGNIPVCRDMFRVRSRSADRGLIESFRFDFGISRRDYYMPNFCGVITNFILRDSRFDFGTTCHFNLGRTSHSI